MGKKKKSAGKKKGVAKKTARKLPRKSAVNVRRLEAEINRLSDLLEVVKKKSVIVRRSLAYLEREQKKVRKQILQARAFLMRMKARGVQAIQDIPHNAEDLYQQVKREFNRLSKKWIP